MVVGKPVVRAGMRIIVVGGRAGSVRWEVRAGCPQYRGEGRAGRMRTVQGGGCAGRMRTIQGEGEVRAGCPQYRGEGRAGRVRTVQGGVSYARSGSWSDAM